MKKCTMFSHRSRKQWQKASVHANCTFCKSEFAYSGDPKNKFRFCCEMCKSDYFVQNPKTHARSKLEIYLEKHIRTYHPSVPVFFSDRHTLRGLELDIHFPDMKLAIEINGPCHYSPVYGEHAFNRTVENDMKKRYECSMLGIKVITIDVRNHSFNKENAIFFAQLITSIINGNTEKLNWTEQEVYLNALS